MYTKVWRALVTSVPTVVLPSGNDLSLIYLSCCRRPRKQMARPLTGSVRGTGSNERVCQGHWLKLDNISWIRCDRNTTSIRDE